MIRTNHIMKLELGLHARPSSYLVRSITKYKLNRAEIIFNGVRTKMNSVLGLLTLMLPDQGKFEVVLEGEDEVLAAKFCRKFFDEPDEETLHEIYSSTAP